MKPIKIGSAKFIRPTLEEVRTQFELKGVTGNEFEKFYAYYESVGWYVGKRKMVSWRGSLAGWILRMPTFNKSLNNTNEKFSQESIRDRLDRW